MAEEAAPIIRLNEDQSAQGSQMLSAHRLLAGYAQACHIKFVVHQNPIAAQIVFQPEFVMPVISIEALRIWKSIHGASQNESYRITDTDSDLVIFKTQADSLFPICAYSPDIGQDHHSTLRILTLCLAARHVLGFVENTTIELSPFIAAWDQMNWTFTDRLPEIIMPVEFDAQFKQREFINYRGARTSLENIDITDGSTEDIAGVVVNSERPENAQETTRRATFLADASAS